MFLEWESLRKHDVCFLITIKAPRHDRNDFPSQFGVAYVRGCEVEGMLDESGRIIEDGIEPKPKLFGIFYILSHVCAFYNWILAGEVRTFRVLMDPNQYHKDMEASSAKKSEDVYDTFSLIMRRKPKENNFKAGA